MSISAHRVILLRNAGSQYLLQIAKYLVPFLTLPYLTRVLGTEGFAARAFVLSVMTFAQIFLEFGFTQYGSRWLVADGRRAGESGRFLGAVTQAKIILQVMGFGVLLIVAPSVSILRDNWAFTVLSYAAVCITVLMPDFVFVAYEQLGLFTVRYVASKTIGVGLTFVLVRGVADLTIVALLDVLVAVIAFLWTWMGLRRRVGVSLRAAPLGQAWRAIRGSMAYLLPNISGPIMNPASTFALGVFGNDLPSVAYWSLAMTVLVAVNSAHSPITASLYPHMINEFDHRLVKRLLVWSVPVSLVSAFAVFLGAELIVLVLGGQGFSGAVFALQATAPIVLLSFPVILLGWPVLGAAGMVRQMMVTSMISTTLMLAGLAILAVLDCTTILSVAILRIGCELFLLFSRLYFVKSRSLLAGGGHTAGS